MPSSYNNDSNFFSSGSNISRKIRLLLFLSMLFYAEVIDLLNHKELMEKFLQFYVMLEMLS